MKRGRSLRCRLLAGGLRLRVLLRKLPTPSRKRGDVLIYGSAEIQPGGAGANHPDKSGVRRGSPSLAALSVLKPNLGVRRQPPRLLSPTGGNLFKLSRTLIDAPGEVDRRVALGGLPGRSKPTVQRTM